MKAEPKLNDLPDITAAKAFPFFLRVEPNEKEHYGPFRIEVGRQYGRDFCARAIAENGEQVDIELSLYDGEYHVNVTGASWCNASRGYRAELKPEYRKREATAP